MKHIKQYETFKEKEDMEYKIFVDMDGVLSDFDRNVQEGFLEEFNKENGTNIKNGWEFEDEYGRSEFWKNINKLGIEFWTEMPWMKDGKKLWNFVKQFEDTEILTKPSKQKICKEAKRTWCKRELGDVKVNILDDKSELAKPNHILIDDLEKNIKSWKAAGGIGILHKNAEDTIKKIKEIL